MFGRGTIGQCPDNQGEYTDMFTAGIVDPARVTRSALQNAASIAGMLLTLTALIVGSVALLAAALG